MKVGMSPFQSALLKGNLMGCGHLKHNACMWFHSQLPGTERGHKYIQTMCIEIHKGTGDDHARLVVKKRRKERESNNYLFPPLLVVRSLEVPFPRPLLSDPSSPSIERSLALAVQTFPYGG